MISVDKKLVDFYSERGFWGTDTLTDVIRRHAARNPDGLAFVQGDDRMTWAQYDDRSNRIAGALIRAGFEPGERIGVQLPDGPGVHAAFIGIEKAGMTAIGFGVRSGEKEVTHLLSRGEAVGLISESMVRGEPSSLVYNHLIDAGLPLRAHLTMPDFERDAPDPRDYLEEIERRRIGPNDLYLLNSTSGTTGLPKMVMQFQNRWFAYHAMAVDAGELTPADVFMCLIPAPYGFAQWTGKFTPTLLGAPNVLMSRFNPEACLELIERNRVTVLMCVSTQFIMLLNSPDFRTRDLSSLRVMFTGGEAIPYDRAAEFENLTGARVLQFFGSNETGALSYTTSRQDLELRLRTCGEVIPFMQVRLFDEDGLDVTAIGGPGQPACKGPVTSMGYFRDDKANAELFTEDGWMLTGDICVIEGRTLRLVGRSTDFIIRGGKNISAAAVEEDVGSHPAVGLAAAVPMPDDVFGERVACYIVLKEGATLTIEELREHLKARGASVETWPERLLFVDTLPMSSGAKVAKGQLRIDIKDRLAAEGVKGR
ncbi:MAG: acyl-CoA synthetase [Chloroflexota bacterium]|jgi:acyl-CoA synthetase|nr:acyl-CoA synthetase [Chloroflexota bacterium]